MTSGSTPTAPTPAAADHRQPDATTPPGPPGRRRGGAPARRAGAPPRTEGCRAPHLRAFLVRSSSPLLSRTVLSLPAYRLLTTSAVGFLSVGPNRTLLPSAATTPYRVRFFRAGGTGPQAMSVPSGGAGANKAGGGVLPGRRQGGRRLLQRGAGCRPLGLTASDGVKESPMRLVPVTGAAARPAGSPPPGVDSGGPDWAPDALPRGAEPAPDSGSALVSAADAGIATRVASRGRCESVVVPLEPARPCGNSRPVA